MDTQQTHTQTNTYTKMLFFFFVLMNRIGKKFVFIASMSKFLHSDWLRECNISHIALKNSILKIPCDVTLFYFGVSQISIFVRNASK